LPPPSIISPPKTCTFHKDLKDDEGYFKSVCVIETQKNHEDSLKVCMSESMRLFDVEDDETVTANMKAFLAKISTKPCRSCLFWINGRGLRGCSSLVKSSGSFTNIKSPCTKPGFAVCEFWNRDYQEKELKNE
jgi:hypothetical protein